MRLLRLSAPVVGALLSLSLPLSAQGARPRRVSPAAPAKPAVTPEVRPDSTARGTTAFLQGVVYDSIGAMPVGGAMIQLEGAGRFGMTDSLGRFLIDSITPGSYRLLVDHPLLDTLGIALVTPPLTFVANQVTRTFVAVPSGETLAGMFCTTARRALGPGALVGRVREPDSELAAEGARVSFVWYDPDPAELPAALRPTRKTPRVREATVGADGIYRLCGLPETYEGKLQAQRKDGGETAEVVVTQDGGVLAMRSMSVARLAVVTRDSTGKVTASTAKGTARVTGRVVNQAGAPVAKARVGLMGTSAAVLTRADGGFTLDSLPAGTQALVVRQVGYSPTEVPVELSSRAPSHVDVHLGVFVPELAPVEVVSRREEGLQKVGFLQRQRSSAGGHFLTPEEIEKRAAQRFTDLLRTMPGIQVQSSNGDAVLTSSRSSGAGNGCVNVYVDGAVWQQITPGDLDSFLQPDEVAAVEVYSGAQIPPQFTTPGQSCTAVVVWTKTRLMMRGKR